MKPWVREELAWAAGFFDGEGTVCLNNHRAVLQVSQLDREALDWFRHVLRFGKVYGPYIRADGVTIHHYRLHRFEHVQAAVTAMWPWLGAVKREQAGRALLAHAEARQAPRMCGAGLHNLKEVDRVLGGCGPCYRDRWPNTVKYAEGAL